MINLPPRKIYIKSEYVSNNKVKNKFITAYFLAVKAVAHKCLQFTVYTEHGAVFSGLPIEALTTTPKTIASLSNEILQPFSCLEGPVSLISYDLLKDAYLNTKLGISGTYLFTLDYEGGGLAEDPEQYKTHNIIALENGQLAALPNNYCFFQDTWFKVDSVFPYKRPTKRYFAGG